MFVMDGSKCIGVVPSSLDRHVVSFQRRFEKAERSKDKSSQIGMRPADAVVVDGADAALLRPPDVSMS